MSGRDERGYVKRLREEEEEADREWRERQRRLRIIDIKRWTGKVIVVGSAIFCLFLLVVFLISPVNATMSTTIISGKGNFDKIVVNYDPIGDDNEKTFLVEIEVPNKEFIGVIVDNSFYNRSMDFYVTVYINSLAQPSEHFVLRTEMTEGVSCKNNISIYFAFGILNEVVVPYGEAYLGQASVIMTMAIIGIIFVGVIVWSKVDRRYNTYYL